MAGEKIKGVTIELNGDATGLDKAIKDATSGIKGLERELNAVNKDLKLSPDSIILLEQKQDLLTQSISKTQAELDILQEAYRQAEAQVASGDLGEDKFRQIQRALVETEAKMSQYQKSLSDTNDHLRQLAETTDDASDEVDNLGENFSKTVDKVEKFAKASMIDSMMSIGDRAADVGEKVQELGSNLVDLSNEYDSATRNAASYFGETGDAAEQTAEAIRNVYAQGFGDSLDSVANAIVAVKKNLSDLDQASLESITAQAMILDETYGIDMNESLRGVNALINRFGLSAQEAMDYLVAGTQNGLDKTNELGDNIAEYAGKFAEAGYSAQEYFQLLNNGLDGGAYNLDKVNDAINEVTTRLADGTMADSLSSYSETTQMLFESWQAGGASQKEVIDSIVADIQNATSQQEAFNMAATAFGTMAEDGGIEFIKSLTSVGDAYGDVIGKAEELNDATTSDSQQMQAAMRQIQMALLPLAQQLTDIALTIIPPLAQKISEILNFLTNNPTIMNIVIAIGAVIAALGALMPVISTVMAIVGAFGTGVLLPVIGTIAAVIAAIAAIVAIVTNWGAITEWFKGVFETVCNALLAAWNNVIAFFSAIPAWWTEVWSSIVEFFRNAVESVKTTASAAFSAVVESIKTRFNEARSFITEVWTNIKEWLSTTVDSIRMKVIETFTNIVNGIKEKATAIKIAVVDGFQGAIDFIESLPEKAVQWGKDFIGGLIDGIKSMISGVVDAVSDVAETITSWLHFSKPDVGPLREYEEWMPDFMAGLSKGIRDNMSLVEGEMRDLSARMTVNPVVATSQRSSSDGTSVKAVMDILEAYLPEIAQQKNVLLDGSALVGRTVSAMDKQLGSARALKERVG